MSAEKNNSERRNTRDSFQRVVRSGPRDINEPQFLGFTFRMDGHEAMITDENAAEVFIESSAFTGWIEKPEFYERIGKDEKGYYLAPNKQI